MYLLESPRRGDSNKYTKCIIYKLKCSNVSVTDALDGSYQVSLQQQIRFYSKIFGNKHRRYNEGPLYIKYFFLYFTDMRSYMRQYSQCMACWEKPRGDCTLEARALTMENMKLSLIFRVVMSDFPFDFISLKDAWLSSLFAYSLNF